MATPIGNLDDISPRALRALAEADEIAAEDTRITARLLQRYGLKARVFALHRHNEQRAARAIVERLTQGRTIALVTDAGTPAISDPGALVVAGALQAGIRVTPIPGPNAAVTALSASGLADGPFLFAGFLPARAAARKSVLETMATLPYTLVFYEAPHRVVESAAALLLTLGPERTLVIARELTKVFEEIHRCRLEEAGLWLQADGGRRLRGEFVLIVSGQAAAKEGAGWEDILSQLLADLPLARAVQLTCRITGARKNAVYARALQLAPRN